MLKPIKSILFATNLSESCRQAFEVAASMAVTYKATLVMLHVIEKAPEYIESRMRSMLGDKGYEDLVQKHSDTARQVIIGKRSANSMIHEALAQFCADSGIDNASCDYQSREIVVASGDVVEEIINAAKEHECSVVVMGAREGFLSDNSIGHIIKSVMRQSRIPVMMVPPEHP